MALAALIAAYHESGEQGVLRATLPLAGRTLVERQVRLAAAAGANPVILVVERMPATLTAALDRLRRDQLPLVVARSVEEAAAAIDPFERLLLIADGAIADPSQIGLLVADPDESVLTVPDSSFGEAHERIDSNRRWAGLAMMKGAVLRETAGMLRDWDLQSTLLRRALQGGARLQDSSGPVAILDRSSDLAGLERQILAAASASAGNLAGRMLAPLERLGASLLLSGPLSPLMVGLGAALATALGALAFLQGWFWPGLILLLAATPLEGVARRLAQLRMQDDQRQSWWSSLLPLLAGAALVAIAFELARTGHGWGMILLAFTTLAFLFALRIELEGQEIRGGLFLAERRGMAWLMVPLALFGLWPAGLVILFAWSAFSFFWAQHEAHSGRSGQKGSAAVETAQD